MIFKSLFHKFVESEWGENFYTYFLFNEKDRPCIYVLITSI